MKRRAFPGLVIALTLLTSAGCLKGKPAYKAGVRAEALGDYDAALADYERAVAHERLNPQYRLKLERLRFEAGEAHVRAGQKLSEQGELDRAAAEFRRAAEIDPSSAVARQELQNTLKRLEAGTPAPQPAPEKPRKQEKPADAFSSLAATPPELAPLSQKPIRLKVVNESKTVFETIGKLAGLNVIFDPDFQSRRISVDLTDITLEQALDYTAMQSKAFWKPLAHNVILMLPDTPQKRKEQEEEIMRTFYLAHSLSQQEVTEIVNALRTMLDLKRVQLVSSQNAILIRDTPDKLLLAEKLIRDVDKSKPEVVVQVSVLQARRDRARSLGIQPGSSAQLIATPRTTLAASAGPAGTVALNKIDQITTGDYSLTLPGAVATALLSDNTTKIIQNPEIRVADGQSAKLRVGDRVPVATGSFQAGIAGIGGVSPLVNTQFQYIDVGVNIDITPRVHPDHEVSLKVAVEISSVSSRVNIGGIDQPVISQRRIEHEIRLREGEASVLGGLVERSDSKSVAGWPGLARIPILRYLFSGENVNSAENEVLLVLKPRIVRLPEISDADRMALSVGTEANTQVRKRLAVIASNHGQALFPASPAAPAVAAQPQDTIPESNEDREQQKHARLRFEPPSAVPGVDGSASILAVVEDAKDLFSISLALKYDPAVLSVEEVRHGGFLSGGTQDVAIVQRINKEKGEASIYAARQPNTTGINGTGPVVRIVVKRVGSGPAELQLVQAGALDSRQRSLQLDIPQPIVHVQ